MFQNRAHAAKLLAAKLESYKNQHPLILAIPRGAVPMAKSIAEALHGDLDIVLVRKLGAPDYAETAVGAVDESGWTYVADHAAAFGADDAYIAAERDRQLAIIKQRRQLYAGRPAVDVAGRIVIVVDDGLATGATMMAALHALRRQKPAKLICAVPVSPMDTLRRIEPLVDEVVCLLTPDYFRAVGQFYSEFSQVEDAEVVAALND